MTLHRVANVMLLLGVAMVSAAALMYFFGEDGPGAAIEDPERDAGQLREGTTSNLAFQIDNPTRHAVRVIGLAEC